MLPELISIKVVGEKPVVGKEDVDRFLVDGGARRGGVVSSVDLAHPRSWSFSIPQNPARLPVQAVSEELVFFEGTEEKAVFGENR